MVTFISRNDSGTGAEGVRVRVLFVEDLETDAELAARRLRTDGIPFFSYRAPSARSARLKRCGAGEFLPILESTGMIVSVGEWALHHVAAECRRWKSEGLRPAHVVRPADRHIEDRSVFHQWAAGSRVGSAAGAETLACTILAAIAPE